VIKKYSTGNCGEKFTTDKTNLMRGFKLNPLFCNKRF
jgi:hypothetical protein